MPNSYNFQKWVNGSLVLEDHPATGVELQADQLAFGDKLTIVWNKTRKPVQPELDKKWKEDTEFPISLGGYYVEGVRFRTILHDVVQKKTIGYFTWGYQVHITLDENGQVQVKKIVAMDAKWNPGEVKKD